MKTPVVSNQLEWKPAEKPAQRSDLLSMMNKEARSSSRAEKKRALNSLKKQPAQISMTDAIKSTSWCTRTKLVKIKPAQRTEQKSSVFKSRIGQNKKQRDLKTRRYAYYISEFKSICCVLLKAHCSFSKSRKACNAFKDKGRKVQIRHKTFQNGFVSNGYNSASGYI
ncbi:hypothetical protein F511_19298 [Dorcoceras hygrometricum]|uniref:Uncharacterized protein n=1 Tax=Dorcoceras hygrometricum TaxID=472368 RepID=A0A2Z7A6Y3_9LAMI|nr:hypothetical protein F511_19298 [Dorcoceras hygrometricum]